MEVNLTLKEHLGSCCGNEVLGYDVMAGRLPIAYIRKIKITYTSENNRINWRWAVTSSKMTYQVIMKGNFNSYQEAFAAVIKEIESEEEENSGMAEVYCLPRREE